MLETEANRAPWFTAFLDLCQTNSPNLLELIPDDLDDDTLLPMYALPQQLHFKVLVSRASIEVLDSRPDAWMKFCSAAQGQDWTFDLLKTPLVLPSDDLTEWWTTETPVASQVRTVELRCILARNFAAARCSGLNIMHYLLPAQRILAYASNMTDTAATACMSIVLDDESYLLLDARLSKHGSCWLLAYPMIPRALMFAIDLTPVQDQFGYGSRLVDSSIRLINEVPTELSLKLPAMIKYAQQYLKEQMDQGPLLVPFSHSKGSLRNRFNRARDASSSSSSSSSSSTESVSQDFRSSTLFNGEREG
jgi:hypothetical protein